MQKVRKACTFALYEGDEFLCLGTIKEIAAYVGMNESSVRAYRNPSYCNKVRKRNGRPLRTLIKIEDDDENE